MVLQHIFVRRGKCLVLKRDVRKFAQLASVNIPEVAVLQSLSNDVFANLAFEDWVYKNVDLSNRRILFLWRNTPSVVIGRHQNPWYECNLNVLEKHGIHLARRMSGGGAVYHDLGNINITFFAPRKLYNRKENLSLIVCALQNRWKTDVSVSCRDDIILNGKYKSNLHGKSTASVKSDVQNLSSVDKSINYSTVIYSLARTFYRTCESRFTEIIDIDPKNSKDFPGLADIQKELQSWTWTFGQTPKFSANFSTTLSFGNFSIVFHTYRGLIEDVECQCNHTNLDFLQRIPLVLKGVPFTQKGVKNVLNRYLNKQAFTGTERTHLVEISRWLEQTLVSLSSENI